MEKEQWKDNILRSLEAAKRAEPAPLLFDKIQAKIAATVPDGQMQGVYRPYLVLAAACLALLVTANVWALSFRATEPTVPSTYQADIANFDLYPSKQ